VLGCLTYASTPPWNQIHDEKELAPANYHGGGNPIAARANTLSVKRSPTGSFWPR
jgi:hypothetical protein